MRTKNTPLFLIPALLQAAAVHAPTALANDREGGGWSSGGGNGVVCFTQSSSASRTQRAGGLIQNNDLSKVASIETYDLFEARSPRGMDAIEPTLIDIEAGESSRSYVERIARRLDHTVPDLARIIRQGLERFPEDQIIIHANGLQQQRDMASADEITDSNCVVTTLAAQFTSGSETYLHLDGRLMRHAKQSRLSRAVLLLHEVLYLHARLLGQTDSRSTRHLVASLITRSDSTTVQSLITNAQALGFLSNEGLRRRKAGGSDIIGQLRAVLAVDEFDEMSLEHNLHGYAHIRLAQWMNPIRQEALRVFDEFNLLQSSRIGRLRTALTSGSLRPAEECSSDLSSCIEHLAIMPSLLSPQQSSSLDQARSLVTERSETIRARLRSFVDSNLRSEVLSTESLPQDTRQQIGEDLVSFTSFLANQSEKGSLSYSDRSHDHQNPYVDRASELFHGGRRLFRERVIFFSTQTLQTSLDYAIDPSNNQSP